MNRLCACSCDVAIVTRFYAVTEYDVENDMVIYQCGNVIAHDEENERVTCSGSLKRITLSKEA